MRGAVLLGWLLMGLHGLAAEPADTPQTLTLFNGKDLTGWSVEGTSTAALKKDGRPLPNWFVKDQAIVCSGNGYGFLRYDQRQFSDFRLHVEYRFLPFSDGKKRMGNSGIGIRTLAYDPKKSFETRPSYAGYEIQLLDDAGRQPDAHSTGSLYRYVAPTENPAKAAPEWNTIDVECRGPRIRIRLNDKAILDYDQTSQEKTKSKPLEGYVSLQCHGSPVEFRNVRVTVADPAK